MSLRFSSVSRRFLKWAAACRSPITVDVYRHYFTRFQKEVGNKIVTAITPSELSAWAKTWHQSQAIVRLMRWCVHEACLCKSNVLEHVQHPPKGQRVRLLTPKEEKQLLAAAADDLRTLLVGYRETMARPGELRKAKWTDVYPKATRKKLRAALNKGKALIVLRDYKNRKSRRMPNEPRVILLSPLMCKMLLRLMPRMYSEATPIFTTGRGRPWTANALRCRMRRLRKKLGFVPDARGENIVPYLFRHTGATALTAAGIRDRMLADILGHTETSTTARYQHLQVGHLQSAMNRYWKRQGKPR